MAKGKAFYTCNACGAQAPKWAGQCADCGAWNTMTETVAAEPVGRGGRFAGYAGGAGGASEVGRVMALDDVELKLDARVSTGIGELDRVLGGGLVYGSVTLIGGDPGIGKSTLLLQALASVSAENRVLYVTGEESLRQVSLRAQRLSVSAAGLRLLSETRVDAIIEAAQREKPQVMVVDSIQTVYTDLLQSAPGSVAQVRESAAQLVQFAKRSGVALFLVGHVTKEGAIAGPRVLEHMVDAVLYFEGDPGSRFRLIRAVKNRFGAVNELGVFAMTEKGLREVTNPSAIFLSAHEQPVAGSVVMVTREGTRPLLVELQALVDESHLGNPRRVTVGLDANRLAMLLAVLHRHGGVAMYDQDVYVNVVGGVRVAETGADLPVLVAALSSFRSRPMPPELVVFGEVGLAGEIRPVPSGEERVLEAVKQGYRRVILPKGNAPRRAIANVEIIPVTRLSEALAAV